MHLVKCLEWVGDLTEWVGFNLHVKSCSVKLENNFMCHVARPRWPQTQRQEGGGLELSR